MRKLLLLILILTFFPITTLWADTMTGLSASGDASVTEGKASIFNFSPKEIKQKMRQKGKLISLMGSNGKGIFYTLFALAVLIEMIRMTRGTPDWAGLIVRALVIVAVLTQYEAIFTAFESVSESIGNTIMGGSAFDNFMDTQAAITSKVQEGFLKEDFGITDIVKPMFFVSMFTYASYVFGIGMHYVYYFAYNIITTGLYFIGPIVISLAVIKELDFTSGFVSSLLTICSWNVISALLINLMSMLFITAAGSDIGFSDVFLLTAFNVAYGISTILVPLFSMLIFSGRNFGVVGVIAGAALFKVATKAVGAVIGKFGGATKAATSSSSSAASSETTRAMEIIDAEPVSGNSGYSVHVHPTDYPRFPGYRLLEDKRVNRLTE